MQGLVSFSSANRFPIASFWSLSPPTEISGALGASSFIGNISAGDSRATMDSLASDLGSFKNPNTWARWYLRDRPKR